MGAGVRSCGGERGSANSVMLKQVALFTTGIPDPTQGGSGIFNYYVCRELLLREYDVRAFFRVSDSFLKDHTVDRFLRELVRRGLKYQLISENRQRTTLDFGFKLLIRAHQAAVCEEVVKGLCPEIAQFDAIIALDLGWALALANAKPATLAILGDPLPDRMRHGRSCSWFRPACVKRWLQMRSLFLPSTHAKLARALGKRLTIGSFSPHHAEAYSSNGIACKHFSWFSPDVGSRARVVPDAAESRLRLLHVGSLDSTASHNMLVYWEKELLPRLARLQFSLDITFVGRAVNRVKSQWQNIRISQTGYEEDLEKEFMNCDVFLSPMKYPVGTRTRILTALSYGVPVIADHSASLGLPELVSGRDIFYASNPDKVARLLEELKEKPQLARNVAFNARLAWEAHYHPVKNVRKLLSEVGLVS